MMHWSAIYQRRNVLAGFFIYGTGDVIAALLAGDASLGRAFGMAICGAFIYAAEIPTYFAWIAKKTANTNQARAILLRPLLALLYFNPLWIARHLAIISLVSGTIEALSVAIFYQAAKSFIIAIPVTFVANLFIQSAIPLRYRFIASALFSCAMAIYYPLTAKYL